LIVYFDTSALLKRYVVEPDSEPVAAVWSSATVIAASQILYAEVAAAFGRRRREMPGTVDDLDRAQQMFRDDWAGMHRIAVDDEINRRVDSLLMRHALRGADAIHLASAVLLRDLAQAEVTFACSDRALGAAAKAEGLGTAP
jgi:predicted nucleic acid-binding protein